MASAAAAVGLKPGDTVRGVKIPSAATLAKYGLDAGRFVVRLQAQGWVCSICGKVPSTGRLVVDHFHVKGWKKLPPEQRRQYIRGLVCWYENHAYLGRGITVEKAREVLAYLERFEEFRPPG